MNKHDIYQEVIEVAITIRLKRMGRQNTAFYRLVVCDEKGSAKGGAYIEELGSINPVKNPAIIKVDKVKISKWLKDGARLSDTAKGILKEAGIFAEVMPKKAPKKKKAKKEKPAKKAK